MPSRGVNLVAIVGWSFSSVTHNRTASLLLETHLERATWPCGGRDKETFSSDAVLL